MKAASRPARSRFFSLRTLPLYAAGWGRTALLYACTAGAASNNTLIWSSMAVPLSFVYSGSLFDFNRSSSFSKPGNVQCEFHRVRALWLWTYVLESFEQSFLSQCIHPRVTTTGAVLLNYAGCTVRWSFLSRSCHTSGSRRLPLPTLFPQRWGIKRLYARFTRRVKRPSEALPGRFALEILRLKFAQVCLKVSQLSRWRYCIECVHACSPHLLQTQQTHSRVRQRKNSSHINQSHASTLMPS